MQQDRSTGSTTPAIRFNNTGRTEEDAKVERIKPQIDAATRQRRLTIIGIVVLAFLGMLYISWERGGRQNPFEPPKNRGSFQPGEQKFD